nr:RNA degradosome polyphosphate kinase [Clostridia bacterium]
MSYFINREISWLKFNKRVLEQSDSATVPVFERMRFLSIFVNNLDEFFMVRAGSLHDRSLLVGELPDNKTGMTAREQLDALYNAARPLCALKEEYFSRVRGKLSEAGITQLDMKSLSDEEELAVHNYFRHDILPLLSPQVIDARHPFPHLENKRMYILASLTMNNRHSYGIIPISDVIGRLLFIDCSKGRLRYLLIEDILLEYVSEIFKQFDVTSRAAVKITRNADVEVADNFSDEDVDYRDYMAVIIKKRERLAPVRLEAYTGAHAKSRKLVEYFMNRLGLGENECYYQTTPIDLSYVSSLDDKIHELGGFPSDIFFGHLSPRRIPLTEDIEKAAKKKDVLLSYPYYSMRPYLDMLERAAKDDSVVSIKITLYRMANNSEVVRLLCLAAENGRDVTVLVELKARFDESNNISWSRRLEEAGCRVIYGMEGL